MFIVFCLLMLVVLFWILNKTADQNNQPNNTKNGINYAPPTEEEKQEAVQHKQDISQKIDPQSKPSSNPASDSNQASVVITSLFVENGKVRGAGIIGNIFEEGGTCTLTLTKGSEKLSGTSQGIQDVNKTTCPPIYIKASGGQWAAVMSYNLQGVSGTSPPQTINVP